MGIDSDPKQSESSEECTVSERIRERLTEESLQRQVGQVGGSHAAYNQRKVVFSYTLQRGRAMKDKMGGTTGVVKYE